MQQTLADGSQKICVRVEKDVLSAITKVHPQYGTFYYWLFPTAFTIAPVLVVDAPFELQYYRTVDAFTALSETNIWTTYAEELIYAAAGERYSAGIQSPKLQYFQQLRIEAWRDLVHSDTAFREASKSRSMGDI